MPDIEFADDIRFSWRRFAFVALLAAALAPVIYRLFWRADRVVAADGEPLVTIHYMAWGNPQQLETERIVIGRFNDLCVLQGKKLRVELFMPPAGGYRQKLLMMLASHKAPDVARVDHYDFASMAGRGYFKDLTDLETSDPTFDLADFHPAAMRENYYNGHLYALNNLFGGMICYYNENLFRAAGLEDPYQLWKKGKWTWEAFEDTAVRLTSRDKSGRPTVYGMTFGGYGQSSAYWALWLWREHGDYLTSDHTRCALNTPEALRGIAEMRGLLYKLWVCPTPSSYGSNAFAFEAGNVAMSVDWAGMTPRFRDAIRDFDWDVAPTPCDPGNSFTLGKGNQLVISNECEHPREAWEWMKYLTSKETEEYFYGDQFRRCVATRWSVLKDPSYLSATKPPYHTDVFVDVIDRARELPIDPSFPIWTATAQRFMDVLFIDPRADLKKTMDECRAAVDIDLQNEHERFQRYAEER